MKNDNKVEQIVNTINDSGINSFSDENLVKTLSILSKEELDYLEANCFYEIGNQQRISSLVPYAKLKIDEELLNNSDLYASFYESIKNNTYLDFFKSLKIDDLGKIKKYLNNTINKQNKSVYEKIIIIITKEIYDRESKKNISF